MKQGEPKTEVPASLAGKFGVLALPNTLLRSPDPDFHLLALTEGIGKAYISHLVDKDYTGTTYGIYQTLIGIMTFFLRLSPGSSGNI